MKHFLFAAFCLLGIGIMQSCSSEENQMVPVLNEEEFASQIKFITYPSVITTRNNPTIPPNPNRGTGIISARIARKSKGCNSGFGLCDFKLFPKKKSTTTRAFTIVPTEDTSVEEYFEIEYDNITNVFYTNMLLAEPVPNEFDDNIFPLSIDEDLYWINDEMALNEIENFIGESIDSETFDNGLLSAKVYKIAAGEISYNASLGLYGGYQVILIPNP